VESALRAGMDSVVLTTMHQPEEFTQPRVIAFAENYIGLDQGLL
jgi:hypothetical protein